jgi:RIO-like serine/threonine protein kinase
MQYTIAEENYIKSVYHLQQQSALVATNHLAEALQTQPASVTDMVKKLTGKKLVHYERYKGVEGFFILGQKPVKGKLWSNTEKKISRIFW